MENTDTIEMILPIMVFHIVVGYVIANNIKSSIKKIRKRRSELRNKVGFAYCWLLWPLALAETEIRKKTEDKKISVWPFFM